jgi:hypothetical protein
MTEESGKNQGKTYEVGKGKPPVDTRFGGKRANKQGKGKPKTFTALRKLAQSIAAEELQSTDGDVITRIEALLRVMSTSRNPADRKTFLEYAFGKPKEEIEQTGESKIELIVKYATNDKPPPATPKAD